MMKYRWIQCDAPYPAEQGDFDQLYEFIRVPQNSTQLREIRIFVDAQHGDPSAIVFYRVRRFENRPDEWYKTDFTLIEEPNA